MHFRQRSLFRLIGFNSDKSSPVMSTEASEPVFTSSSEAQIIFHQFTLEIAQVQSIVIDTIDRRDCFRDIIVDNILDEFPDAGIPGNSQQILHLLKTDIPSRNKSIIVPEHVQASRMLPVALRAISRNDSCVIVMFVRLTNISHIPFHDRRLRNAVKIKTLTARHDGRQEFLWTSVVARMKMTCGGGSFPTFSNKALEALAAQHVEFIYYVNFIFGLGWERN